MSAELKSDHIKGMKYCLKLIQQLRKEYAELGYRLEMVSIERILCDVENEIGMRVYRDWKIK